MQSLLPHIIVVAIKVQNERNFVKLLGKAVILLPPLKEVANSGCCQKIVKVFKPACSKFEDILGETLCGYQLSKENHARMFCIKNIREVCNFHGLISSRSISSMER
jgi:hypothetical protein